MDQISALIITRFRTPVPCTLLKATTTTFKLQEKYRPYIGINFHQRNYQSAKSSYAGFSFVTGCELDIRLFLFNEYSHQLRILSLARSAKFQRLQEINILRRPYFLVLDVRPIFCLHFFDSFKIFFQFQYCLISTTIVQLKMIHSSSICTSFRQNDRTIIR
jgi:hypothetical protein